ncbi:MAG: ATP-binding protein [Campylobacterales bacterium]
MQTYTHEFKNYEMLEEFIAFYSLNKKENLLVQCFSSVYDRSTFELLWHSLSTLLPYAQILGSTTPSVISNEDVKKESVSIVFTLFEKSKLTGGEIQLYEKSYNKSSLEQTTKELLDKSAQEDIKLIIIFGNNCWNEAQMLTKEIGICKNRCIIAGGMAGIEGSSIEPPGLVFSRYGIVERGFAYACISGKELIVNNGYSFAYKRIGPSFKITKADGNIIKSIDNISLKQLYARYLGRKSTEDIVSTSSRFPLVLKKRGIKSALMVTDTLDDDSVKVSSNIKEGDEVKLGYIHSNILHNNAYKAATKLAEYPIESLFIYSCASRFTVLDGRLATESSIISNLGKSEGMFTFGEFYGNDLLSVGTMTVVALSESEDKILSKKALNLLVNDVLDAGWRDENFQNFHMMNALTEKITSDLIRTNKKLAKSKKMLQDTTSSIDAMIFQLKQTKKDFLRFTFVSSGLSRCVKVLEIEKKTLLKEGPKAIGELMEESCREKFSSDINKMSSQKSNFVETYLIKTKDGNKKWIEITANCDGSSNDDVLWNGFITDITEHKEYEDKLKIAKNEAQRANLSKMEFLANMSHEIRTPLNAILGFSELLEKTDTTPKQKSYLESITSGGRTLLMLINDILDLSKIEVGKMSLKEDYIEPASVIEEVLKIFSLKVESKDLCLEAAIDPRLKRVFLLDGTRLRQVLFNLIGNAVKFTDEGSINVEAGLIDEDKNSKKSDIFIKISDTGIGINKDEQEKIFSAFEQQETQSTRKYGGTGLGLSISKKLVEIMGGRIELQSTPNEGSVFTIILKDIKQGDAVDGKSRNQTKTTYSFSSANVLVVDDVPSNRELIVELLKQYGIQTLEAENGAEALRIMDKTLPDLVILDLRMPVMDGYEASRIIRKTKLYANIPIIVLTASVNSLEEEREVEALGVDAFLKKPVEEKVLLYELSKHLNSDVFESEKGEDRGFEINIDISKVKKPQELKSYIQEDAQSKYKKAKTSGSFDIIEEFANSLKQRGEIHNVDALKLYANNLLESVDAFDIAGIESVLEDFERIQTKIIEHLSRSEDG